MPSLRALQNSVAEILSGLVDDFQREPYGMI